jgi:tRNA dimethylallyltransferase
MITQAEKIIDAHVPVSEKVRVIAVAGATASGKSALAVEIAKRYNGEVVSFDSMQIYKDMDIGTAKPTTAEMEGIPHHLIDFADPKAPFSCAEYAELAKVTIAEIAGRGKLPVMCGGTGLYLDSVIAVSNVQPSGSNELRRELDNIAASLTPEEFHDILRECDPESADKIHPHNVRRVIRALEIFRHTGVTKTEWDRRSKETPAPYDATVIGINYTDRQRLYDRIDLRVDIMIENGLVEEARRLYESGALDPRGGGIQAIGYKELIPYLDGAISLEQAREQIAQSTRNYAKRQITWFKAKAYVNWIDV